MERRIVVLRLAISLALGVPGGAGAAKAVSQAPGAGLVVLSREAQLSEGESRLDDATVEILNPGCGGVLVGDARHVVTAAHCIADPWTALNIKTSSGEQTSAAVQIIDRGQDFAILELVRAVREQPLEISEVAPNVGDTVLFISHVSQSGLQVQQIQRLGRCPSLPSVPAALFTTIEAVKGDSGSPLVDERVRVVGLVHGGAACHIAAPTAVVAPILAKVIRGELPLVSGWVELKTPPVDESRQQREARRPMRRP